MSNNQTIQIVVKSGEKTVKVKLPPKPNLLERSLKVFYNTGDNEINERDYDEDDYRYPSKISKELKRNKKFKKSFDLALEEFGDLYYHQCRFSNVLEILTNKNKVSINQTIDKDEWKKLFSSVFINVNRKNVEFLVIHVSSKISEEEKSKVIDDITQTFLNIPVKIFKSDKKSKFTLIEILFFGTEVKKYNYEDY
tara:strand:+ start:5241 stop:5825 length:585 start_codon:yes stop_codon:yes gene_type:complete